MARGMLDCPAPFHCVGNCLASLYYPHAIEWRRDWCYMSRAASVRAVVARKEAEWKREAEERLERSRKREAEEASKPRPSLSPVTLLWECIGHQMQVDEARRGL